MITLNNFLKFRAGTLTQSDVGKSNELTWLNIRCWFNYKWTDLKKKLVRASIRCTATFRLIRLDRAEDPSNNDT